jgi:hypothetical protein
MIKPKNFFTDTLISGRMRLVEIGLLLKLYVTDSLVEFVLEYNDHSSGYSKAKEEAEYCEQHPKDRRSWNSFKWGSAEEMQKALDTNRVWSIRWQRYGNGSNTTVERLHGASLVNILMRIAKVADDYLYNGPDAAADKDFYCNVKALRTSIELYQDDQTSKRYTAQELEDSLMNLLQGEHSSLSIYFNDWIGNWPTVKEAIEMADESDGGCGLIDSRDWVSPEDKQVSIDTNSIWCLQWYPHTPVGFCSILASGLQPLLSYVFGATVDKHN